MDRGAGFGGRTTGDVQGNNQQGEEDWIHFFEVVDLYGDQYGFNFFNLGPRLYMINTIGLIGILIDHTNHT